MNIRINDDFKIVLFKFRKQFAMGYSEIIRRFFNYFNVVDKYLTILRILEETKENEQTKNDKNV